jgi:hypothetical protein
LWAMINSFFNVDFSVEGNDLISVIFING